MREHAQPPTLEEHVAQALAQAPAPTDEQRQMIARLLTPAGGVRVAH